MLLDLLAQIEPDDSWHRRQPDPTALAATRVAQPGQSVGLFTSMLEVRGPQFGASVYGLELLQYTALVGGLVPVAGQTPLPTPVSPDRIARPLQLPAAAHLAWTTGALAPVLETRTPTFGGAVYRTELFQYASLVGPFTSSLTPQTLTWLTTYPDRLSQPAPQHTSFTTGSSTSNFPVPNTTDLTSYPDRLSLPPAVPATQFAWNPTTLPAFTYTTTWYPDRLPQLPSPLTQGAPVPSVTTPELAWKGVHSDRVWQPQPQHTAWTGVLVLTLTDLRWLGHWADRLTLLPEPQHLAWVTGTTPSEFPVDDVRWQGTYPSLLRQPRPDHPSGPTQYPSAYPVPNTSWVPHAPDQLLLAQLSRASHPYEALEPFPRAGAVQLSDWSRYPDRLTKIGLTVAQIPSFTWATFDTPPNRLIVIDPNFHLGTKGTFDTSWPVLGGWENW